MEIERGRHMPIKHRRTSRSALTKGATSNPSMGDPLMLQQKQQRRRRRNESGNVAKKRESVRKKKRKKRRDRRNNIKGLAIIKQ